MQFQPNPLPSNLRSDLPGVKAMFLSKLTAYLDDHLANTNLVAASVAEVMIMSKSTLNRRLKLVSSLTINDFIKHYRLQRSVEFLRAGYKVKEVSRQVGFKTPSYFAQCFKAYYKQTPSEYYKPVN